MLEADSTLTPCPDGSSLTLARDVRRKGFDASRRRLHDGLYREHAEEVSALSRLRSSWLTGWRATLDEIAELEARLLDVDVSAVREACTALMGGWSTEPLPRTAEEIVHSES